MNQSNSIQEYISGFSEKISVFFENNHDIAFLVFIGVFVFFTDWQYIKLEMDL